VAAFTGAQRWVIGLTSVASFMVALDLLVVSTALTTIKDDLGASLAQVQWAVTGYGLAFAVLLMAGAALGDRFGRRRVFTIGLGCSRLPRRGARCRRAWAGSLRRGSCRVPGQRW
jgi:MFS family permease